MSVRETWALPSDFHAQMRALLPGVTDADFVHLDRMFTADAVIGDEGEDRPQLVAWVAHVMERSVGVAA